MYFSNYVYTYFYLHYTYVEFFEGQTNISDKILGVKFTLNLNY